MLLSLASGTGSNALGSTQQGAYHLSVEAHAAFVADVFNAGADGWSLVQRIVRANYGDNVAVPRLKVRNLPTRPWLQIVDTATKAAVAGLLTADDPTEAVIRGAMGLGPHDPATARARPSNMGTPAAKETGE